MARMVHDQKLVYYRRRCEDMENALHEIIELYGDDSLTNEQAQDRTFEIATQTLTLGAWSAEREAHRA